MYTARQANKSVSFAFTCLCCHVRCPGLSILIIYLVALLTYLFTYLLPYFRDSHCLIDCFCFIIYIYIYISV